jgi:hypothetical protein
LLRITPGCSVRGQRRPHGKGISSGICNKFK